MIAVFVLQFPQQEISFSTAVEQLFRLNEQQLSFPWKGRGTEALFLLIVLSFFAGNPRIAASRFFGGGRERTLRFEFSFSYSLVSSALCPCYLTDHTFYSPQSFNQRLFPPRTTCLITSRIVQTCNGFLLRLIPLSGFSLRTRPLPPEKERRLF